MSIRGTGTKAKQSGGSYETRTDATRARPWRSTVRLEPFFLIYPARFPDDYNSYRPVLKSETTCGVTIIVQLLSDLAFILPTFVHHYHTRSLR